MCNFVLQGPDVSFPPYMYTVFSWFIINPIFLADFSKFKKASLGPGVVRAIKSMSSA